jgi:hypothetical protein
MGGMSIWILALLVMGAVTLAGWRQGGIRASIAFVGILFAWLLAGLAGKIFHPLLPHLGATNPILAWALAPLCGFILVSILFQIAAFNVHKKVDVHYKYKAGDLRLALWERLNARLGICVGLLNGATYFILICFVIFNLAYWTTQVSAATRQPSLMVRLVNQLGRDLQSTGLSRTASAVGTLSPRYYHYADLSGLLLQNPQIGPRFAAYPALTSLWERDDMQGLISDNALTNALLNGGSLGEIINQPSVQELWKNKEQTRRITGILDTNLDDLAAYLQTGKSAKYDGEKILGRWEFNVGVSIAWFRQSQPKIQASEMRAIRAAWSQAYAQTSILVAGDNQVFIRSLPRFKAQQAAPEINNWKGDWSVEGTNYTLHVTFNGEDKFLSATTDGLRMSVKDGRNQLIFDHVD